MKGILPAWGRILQGYKPNLSIEITRECPLRCPGCYAYGDEHLGGDVTLRQMADLKGDALIAGVIEAVRIHRPIHLSIIGGEPLVRFRELDRLLPQLSAMGLYVQVVTSAVRPLPAAWAAIPRLQLVVSIDGLAPEHDVRRAPATYDRVLKHIAGHHVTVHCTVTRQIIQRDGYLEEFLAYWSANPDASQVWFSLYTPQVGEQSEERLEPEDRQQVVRSLLDLRGRYPKLRMPEGLINVYLAPPSTPDACTFAKTPLCLSSDLVRRITPCQFGGNPSCDDCGCIASAGLDAIARHRLPGGLHVGAIFDASFGIGNAVATVSGRRRKAKGHVQAPARVPAVEAPTADVSAP
ncbi:MAG: radical SAM protein [Luteitalea sp.]